MNRREARSLLERGLAAYRGRPYAEMVALVGSDKNWTETGASGTEYQLEIAVRWDAEAGGAIRIMASVGDGGWGSWLPEGAELLIEPGRRA
jgi:hypothetical protein